MRATICQLATEAAGREAQWAVLAEHLRRERSDFLLLPEMPFNRWLAAERAVDTDAWAAAVAAHEGWIARIGELGVPAAAGTRPVVDGGHRHNRAWVWHAGRGHEDVHDKYYLPDEPGYWEASWYQPAPAPLFEPCLAGDARAGFQICTEMWFMQHARAYGEAGAQLVLVPRATPHESIDKWLAGGRAAAVVAGAFCLSSNLYAPPGSAANLGGLGFICDPEGEVLATTSPDAPFATVEIDLGQADTAKQTFPRYVRTQSN